MLAQGECSKKRRENQPPFQSKMRVQKQGSLLTIRRF
jgi:hypothetical protein